MNKIVENAIWGYEVNIWASLTERDNLFIHYSTHRLKIYIESRIAEKCQNVPGELNGPGRTEHWCRTESNLSHI